MSRDHYRARRDSRRWRAFSASWSLAESFDLRGDCSQRSPGLPRRFIVFVEPSTFSVLTKCDNRYTMKPCIHMVDQMMTFFKNVVIYTHASHIPHIQIIYHPSFIIYHLSTQLTAPIDNLALPACNAIQYGLMLIYDCILLLIL